jgi:hypothetical protein
MPRLAPITAAMLAHHSVSLIRPQDQRAVNRSEVVTVSVDGEEFELRRPTPLGAILIKARSIMRHADPSPSATLDWRTGSSFASPRSGSAARDRNGYF